MTVGEEFWLLRLYVAGQTPRSLTAYANLKDICERHLRERYEIEVIDLNTHPEHALANEIVALPTLVKCLPEPVTRIVGDLSDVDKVLAGLAMVSR